MNKVLRVTSHSILAGHSDVNVFVLENGDKVFAHDWNGDEYLTAWRESNNSGTKEDLESVKPVYTAVRDEESEEIELVGIVIN